MRFHSSTEFCIRVDYVNRLGEHHYTIIYGSELFDDAEDLDDRLHALTDAYKALEREIIAIQRIEGVAVGLFSKPGPRKIRVGPVPGRRHSLVSVK